MSKYRKKPIEVEAFQLGVDSMPKWFINKVNDKETLLYECVKFNKYKCLIKTLEGTMKAEHGDYIIKGIAGEIYPCKPEIFEKTYEKVEE